MAIVSLRRKIAEMGIHEALQVPSDYEEATVRNYASCMGRTLGRTYSVTKNTKTRVIHVVRHS